jgi:UDP:flavonoid glycosyltransferase YjiC (YdhE family)
VARLLFVVPPFVGHINPTISLGAELSRRGHDVAWAGPAAGVSPHLGPGRRLYDTNPDLDEQALTGMLAGGAGQRGLPALKFLWEHALLPLARAMRPGVEGAVEAFEPEAVVVDQQALAGAVVARRRSLPWVTSASTSAELTDPLSSFPLVDRWIRNQLVDLQLDGGVDGGLASEGDLRCSPRLTIAYTTEALVGPCPAWPGPLCFVGPAIADRRETVAFPWDWLDTERRVILVSLGTLNAEAGNRFFGVVAEALDQADLQVVCVSPPELVPEPPANLLALARVPQLALLARVAALVCHAGHNTVVEALAHGLPLVLAPIRDDQPVIAEQVVRAGAGVQVRFGRVRAEGLIAAVRAVLDDPRYRRRAEAIQASFATAGGTPLAAEQIEAALATAGPRT